VPFAQLLLLNNVLFRVKSMIVKFKRLSILITM